MGVRGINLPGIVQFISSNCERSLDREKFTGLNSVINFNIFFWNFIPSSFISKRMDSYMHTQNLHSTEVPLHIKILAKLVNNRLEA